MVATAFHPLGRNRPDRSFKIDLAGSQAATLAGPGRCQIDECQGAGGIDRTRAQRRNEGRNVALWPRGVMPPRALCGLRQRVLEMPAPARRGLTLALPLDLRRIEDTFDPPTHPARHLWLLPPDRAKGRPTIE